MRDFLLASREPGKLLHAFANFLPRHTQLIELLEVQPKLRADAKPVAKTQRCVRRDTALAIDDFGDPIDRHVNLPRQLRCRNVEFSQLFGKMLAGVNRGAGVSAMPHLVVINDLDIDRAGRSFGPFKTNPPLVIDAVCSDRPLPGYRRGLQADCREARLGRSSCTLPQGDQAEPQPVVRNQRTL